jgi:hypothetical protein
MSEAATLIVTKRSANVPVQKLNLEVLLHGDHVATGEGDDVVGVHGAIRRSGLETGEKTCRTSGLQGRGLVAGKQVDVPRSQIAVLLRIEVPFALRHLVSS